MSVCIALSLPIMAQRKVKTKVNAPATWAESIAAAKKQANSEMQRTCLPVVSQVIKAKTAAVPFTADVHNMQQAARVSDKTAFFYMGEMVEFDNTKKIFTNPEKEATQNYITGRFG